MYTRLTKTYYRKNMKKMDLKHFDAIYNPSLKTHTIIIDTNLYGLIKDIHVNDTKKNINL